MKSLTIKRSALSKETIDVIKNLAGDKNMELNNRDLYNNEDDNTPNEYLREEAPVVGARESKSKEIDLLWQSFKPSQLNSNSPMMCFIGGVLTGIVATIIVLVLFGALTSSDFTKKSNTQQTAIPAVEAEVQENEEMSQEEPIEAGVVETNEEQETAEAQTPANMEKYVIKNGDTVEAIIKHYYGSYTPERAEAIMKANNLKNLDHISIDQVLLIPLEQ